MKKLKVVLSVFVILFLVVVLVKAVSFALALPTAVTKTIEATAPPPERIELTRQVMVKALESKFEMTSFSMRLEKYVPGGVCDGNAWQRFAFRDCVVMLIPAKVNAGFDWRSFGANQIETTHDEVVLNIGTPKIQDVVIDHAKINVLGHDQGFFVATYDESLQARVLAAAETAFRKDACDNGILEAAGLSAKDKLGDMLRTLFKKSGDTRTVRIVFNPPAC